MQIVKFYVYVYLDPRKPGKYVYGQFEFDYQPFYVGKGQYNRKFDHITQAYSQDRGCKCNNYKCNKIKKIKEVTGNDPIVIQYKSNIILQSEAFQLQTKMINTIGRLDLNLGPLTNLTNGGDGASGYKATEQENRKNSQRNSGLKNPNYRKAFPEDHCNKIAIGVSKHERTEQHCSAISAARKGCVSNRKGVILSDQIIKNMKDARPIMDDAYKQKIKDGFTEQMRKQISERRKKYLADTRDERLAEFKKSRDEQMQILGYVIEQTQGRFFVRKIETNNIVFCKNGYDSHKTACKLTKRKIKK